VGPGVLLGLRSSPSTALEQVKQIWLLLDDNILTEANEHILGEGRISGLLPLKLPLHDLNRWVFFLTTTGKY